MMIKVNWPRRPIEEAIWEMEVEMREQYHSLWPISYAFTFTFMNEILIGWAIVITLLVISIFLQLFYWFQLMYGNLKLFVTCWDC